MIGQLSGTVTTIQCVAESSGIQHAVTGNWAFRHKSSVSAEIPNPHIVCTSSTGRPGAITGSIARSR